MGKGGGVLRLPAPLPPALPWPTPEGFSAQGVFAGLLVCGGGFAVLGVHARFGLWDAVHTWDASESASTSASIASPAHPPFPPSGAVERRHVCPHGLPCI